MKTTFASFLVPAFLSALGGCDSQVDPAYEGEVLFSMNGTVVVDDAEAPKNLVPALTYSDQREGEKAMLIEPVAFEGTFPANIRLKVFSPPPPEALSPIFPIDGLTPEDAKAGEPALALGLISAVPPGTDRIFPLDNARTTIDCLAAEEEGSDAPCTLERVRCAPDFDIESVTTGACTSFPEDRLSECDPDGACFFETYECDPSAVQALGVPKKSCTVVNSFGNPEYSGQTRPPFAGLSRNVAVLYLDAPAKAGSVTSRLFNRGEEIAAGYTLLRGRMFSEEEIDASRSCYVDAVGEVTRRHSEDHPGEPITPKERRELQFEMIDYMIDRDCSTALYTSVDYEAVKAVGDEPIEIKIYSDLSEVTSLFDAK